MTPSEVGAARELTQLRDHGTVLALEPDFHQIGATPIMMMDIEMARRALQVGTRQGAERTEEFRAAWDT